MDGCKIQEEDVSARLCLPSSRGDRRLCCLPGAVARPYEGAGTHPLLRCHHCFDPLSVVFVLVLTTHPKI